MTYTKNIRNLVTELTTELDKFDEIPDDMITQKRNQSLNLTASSEALTLAIRQLPLSLGMADKTAKAQIISDTLGIKIEVIGNVTRVTIPAILPKRGLGQAHSQYLGDSLHSAIWLFKQDNEYLHYNGKVLLIQENHYDEECPIKLLHDHDNIEKKVIIDTLVSNFLIDDSPILMSNLTITTQGKGNYTQFTIVPIEEAVQYLQYYCIL